MGTPLTGSTVSSTYTGLLKTTDTAIINSSLKTICDGGGNDSSLKLSTTAAAFTGTLDVAGNVVLDGNITVNTNKFTVVAASGNTAVGGTFSAAGATTLSSTLNVTGAAVFSSTLNVTGAVVFSSTVAASGNISTSGGNLSVYGNIVQSNAGASNTLAGSLTVGNAAVFNGGVTFNSTTTFTSAISVAGITNTGTFLSTGAATIGTVGGATLGACTISSATVSGFLTVAGPSTLNGNTTLGDAAGDTVTVGSATVTFTNLAAKSTPLVSTDRFLILDSANPNQVRTVLYSAVGAAKFIYSETIVKPVGSEQSVTVGSGGYDVLEQSGSTSDWSYTWTPKTVGNKALLKVSIPIYIGNVPVYGQTSFYAGIVKDSGAAGDVVAVAAQFSAENNSVVLIAQGEFTSTSATHTFKVWFGSAIGSTITVAKNGTATWFNNNASTRNAKVQFELIEF
jgi:hypothetical protein